MDLRLCLMLFFLQVFHYIRMVSVQILICYDLKMFNSLFVLLQISGDSLTGFGKRPGLCIEFFGGNLVERTILF